MRLYDETERDVFGGYKLMDVPKKYHQNSVGESIGGVTEAEEYTYSSSDSCVFAVNKFCHHMFFQMVLG